MHFNPSVFGGIDELTLVSWWQTRGAKNMALSWWLLPFAGLVILLGMNTICCFLDWLRKIRGRWRKLGEYMIHLGCIMVLGAYIWGSFTGFRNDSIAVYLDQPAPIKGMPGYYLRLDQFEPVLNDQGRPLDMRSQVALLRGDKLVTKTTISINHPLLWRGLVVVPVSFGRDIRGFRFFRPQQVPIDLEAGSRLPLQTGGELSVELFYSDAVRRNGQVFNRSNQLRDPALLLRIEQPGQSTWRGWYFLRESPPYPLVAAGLRIRPTQPLYKTYSVLTMNNDPGAKMALVGGGLLVTGIAIALASFYRKRRTGDHPDII